MTESFDVRFHAGGANWPANPYHFQGKGQVIVEQDFVRVRGKSHRSFRMAARAEHRLRMVDIVNVHTDGECVIFHVLGVRENLVVGFSTADAATARRLAALLPQRRTEAFAVAHAEREEFHDRIDYWSPSTPVTWTLLVLNVGIYVLMWLERLGLAQTGHLFGPGWGSLMEAQAHWQLLMQGISGLTGQVAHARQWWPLLDSFLGWGPMVNLTSVLQQMKQWGSNVPVETLLNGKWWRLLTSTLLHGNMLHLGLNMIALWQVGQLVERLFGSLRFTYLYLLAGLSGSAASALWNLAALHPNANSLGASGAIFGIVGGLFAFTRRENSGMPPTVVNELRGALLPFLVFNLTAGFLYPHTDNAAHIGGLIGGWLAGHLLARSLHVPAQPQPQG